MNDIHIHFHLSDGFNGQIWTDEDGRVNVRSSAATPGVEPARQPTDVEQSIARLADRNGDARTVYDAFVRLGWTPRPAKVVTSTSRQKAWVRFERSGWTVYLDSVKVYLLTKKEPLRSFVEGLPHGTTYSQGVALYYDRRTPKETAAKVVGDVEAITQFLDGLDG